MLPISAFVAKSKIQRRSDHPAEGVSALLTISACGDGVVNDFVGIYSVTSLHHPSLNRNVFRLNI